MTPQVVVVGSFVQDLMWRCNDFPHEGQTIIGTFFQGPGGKGSNQAVASGRTGVPTLFIGAVGSDLFADGARAFYKAEGIGAHFIEIAGHATGTAAILVNERGQNEIVVALGASARLRPRDLDLEPIRKAQVVVCQHEANLPINEFVFRTARKAGVTTVLNPAPMRGDFDPGILKLTDVLIPNESEFAELVNLVNKAGRPKGPILDKASILEMKPEALHATCRMLGVPTVIVTLGERGCLVSRADGPPVHISGHKGIKVIDTTGAGDGFVGGFAAGLVLHQGDAIKAARHGNAVAALSVTKPGTAPSMPRADELSRFLSRRPV